MSNVEAVSFPNADGLTLFGTLHRPPDCDTTLPAVVLLSPGVKMRVGPGRLYVPLTEMLTSLGYVVLRFDFYGLGDSEGELQEKLVSDVYNSIELGRYLNDTLSALAWLNGEHGFDRFVLGGLCGGAVTALLAAQRDERVEALLAFGMTVTLSRNEPTSGKYMTRVALENRRRGYSRKLLNPTAWIRFLTFRSEYSVIWRSMKRMLVKESPKPSNNASASIEQLGNANPLFPSAFFAFLERGGRALMLFSEKDGVLAEYEEKFVEPFFERLRPFLPQLDKHVIANANHVMSLQEWRREMVDISRQWLLKLRVG